MPQRIDTAILTEFLNTLSPGKRPVLMLDYDGTLAPFQNDRFHAYPYSGVLPLLQAILNTTTRVIIVTGRPIHEVQALLQPLTGIEIWGAHGLDHLLPDGNRRQLEIVPELADLLQQAQEKMKQRSLEHLLEIKPGGVAIHWRGLSEETTQAVAAQALQDWTDLAQHPGLKLLNFEGGLELRVLRPDKGDAIATVLKQLDRETPVAFLGDDLTDEDGFRVLSDRGLPILVRDEYRETSARAWLKPPDELLYFLEQWVSRTTSTKQTDPLH